MYTCMKVSKYVCMYVGMYVCVSISATVRRRSDLCVHTRGWLSTYRETCVCMGILTAEPVATSSIPCSKAWSGCRGATRENHPCRPHAGGNLSCTFAGRGTFIGRGCLCSKSAPRYGYVWGSQDTVVFISCWYPSTDSK